MTIATMDEEFSTSHRCETCESTLSEGMNLLRVSEGIYGSQGWVDLERPLEFCNEICLSKYFEGLVKELDRLPDRVP